MNVAADCLDLGNRRPSGDEAAGEAGVYGPPPKTSSSRTYKAHEVDVFGVPRGMYVDGVGVVFSTDISLFYTPMVTPFQLTFPPEQKLATHSAKRS